MNGRSADSPVLNGTVLIKLYLFMMVLYSLSFTLMLPLESHKNIWVYVMISVRPADRASGRVKNINAAIFSDTVNVINVKHCIMVLRIELYLFTPLSVPWSYFKVTAESNSFNRKFNILMRWCLNFVWLLTTSTRSWTYHYFYFRTYSRKTIDTFPALRKAKQTLTLAFFKATSFKLCKIITLLGVY